MTIKDEYTGKNYIRQDRYKKRHKKTGLCVSCPEVTAPTSDWRCIYHLEKHRADEAKRRESIKVKP